MTVWLVAVVLLIEAAAIAAGLVALALGQIVWLPASLTAAAGSVLFGGLGGCAYCLRGVYLNACVRKSWDNAWLPWYFVRPAVSLILGGVSFLFVKSGLLLFGSTQQPEAGNLGVWAVAFLAGLNVDRFVVKIESVGQTVWGQEPSRQSKSDNLQEDPGGGSK